MGNMGNVEEPGGGRTCETGPVLSPDAEKTVQSVGDLPAMPHIAAQIMQKLANPCSTPREIHELIAKDQSLAARVLKVANSPYYGASRSISSIKEAILFMGFDSIRSLVTTAIMKGIFSAMSDSGIELWEHSICCAVAAKKIGNDVGFQGSEEAFLAGLIHDIGKWVIFLQFPAGMSDIMLMVGDGKSFLEAERELLGFTHAEVGQLLTNKWLFTPTLENVVANHHRPDCAGSDQKLAHIISLADSLCHKLGIGPTKRPEIDPDALESTRALGLGDRAISGALDLMAETISVEKQTG